MAGKKLLCKNYSFPHVTIRPVTVHGIVTSSITVTGEDGLSFCVVRDNEGRTVISEGGNSFFVAKDNEGRIALREK